MDLTCSVSVDWTLLQHCKAPVLHCELTLEAEGLAVAVPTRATARMMRVVENCMSEIVKERRGRAKEDMRGKKMRRNVVWRRRRLGFIGVLDDSVQPMSIYGASFAIGSFI